MLKIKTLPQIHRLKKIINNDFHRKTNVVCLHLCKLIHQRTVLSVNLWHI